MRFLEPQGHAAVLHGLWRAAREGRLAHALCFVGPEGVGKFLSAERLAAGLMCAHAGDGPPCGACGPCKRLRADAHPDVLVVDPTVEGLESISIGHVTPRDNGPDQTIEQFLALRPMEGGWRIVLIREADRLVEEAQNALLKTLEEPGDATLLVLETARPDRLLPTIHSRCVRVPFAALDVDDVRAVLEAAVRAEVDRFGGKSVGNPARRGKARGAKVHGGKGQGSDADDSDLDRDDPDDPDGGDADGGDALGGDVAGGDKNTGKLDAGLTRPQAEALARWSRGAPGIALQLHARGALLMRAAIEAALGPGAEPFALAAAVGTIDGDFPGKTASVRARGRARTFLDLCADVLRDGARAAAGIDARDLAHPDLAVQLARAPEAAIGSGLERILAARQDVDANLAPDAAIERALLALEPLRSIPATGATRR